ncbi:MAG: tetratricopeptide repeat protein [Planctomycetes bacterium]|nr:tetratricopeptide repeat protein [Planctomycetota bacterium]
MVSTIRQPLLCALALLLALPLGALAQEAGKQGRRIKEGERERDRPFHPEEGRRPQQRGWDRGRFRQPPREQNPFADLGELNVVDKAFYTVAELLYDKGEYENAIKELSKVVDESPDERAKAGAHLVAGHICRFKLQDTGRAIEEYKQVTGDLADRAMKSMIQCYEAMNQPDEAAKILEDRLTQTTQPQEKAFILNEMANIYRRAQNIDKAIEALRRIPQMITYQEAEALRLGRGAGEALPMDRIREHVERLRAEGRFEDAERLQKKVREMQEKLRGAKRRNPPAPGEPPEKGPEE